MELASSGPQSVSVCFLADQLAELVSKLIKRTSPLVHDDVDPSIMDLLVQVRDMNKLVPYYVEPGPTLTVARDGELFGRGLVRAT